MKTALLVIAHGSRHEVANGDTRFLAEELRRGGEFALVEAAFLELAEPDIDGGAETCVAGGAERVVLVPYFLSAGVHVRRDLEEYRNRLSEKFPQVEFLLAEPLGRHPLLIEVVKERAREVVQTIQPD